MFAKIVFILFILLVLCETYRILIHNKASKLNKKENNSNICRGYLTDKEYLEHMIPHHQVAIDISIELQKKTKWPVMQEILRKIIWTQKYEIAYMEDLLAEKNSEYGMSEKNNMQKIYIATIADFIYPNKKGLTNTYCDPQFFDPEKHMEHIKKMNLTDEMYIHHMIPHHQVAVDMSKVLLSNTTSDHMIYLAYRIIRSQQDEIMLLNELNNKSAYKLSATLI